MRKTKMTIAKMTVAAVCGSLALFAAGPASASEWTPTKAAYYTAKYYANQAAKAVLDVFVPSAHAKKGHGKGLGHVVDHAGGGGAGHC